MLQFFARQHQKLARVQYDSKMRRQAKVTEVVLGNPQVKSIKKQALLLHSQNFLRDSRKKPT